MMNRDYLVTWKGDNELLLFYPPLTQHDIVIVVLSYLLSQITIKWEQPYDLLHEQPSP